MDAAKTRINNLTIGEIGLTEFVEHMLIILKEIRDKSDKPNAPNWHDMADSTVLIYAVNAGLVNKAHFGMGTSYCLSKKGEEFYTSLRC